MPALGAPRLCVGAGVAGGRKSKICFWPPPQNSYESYGAPTANAQRPHATWEEVN
jgi:hypothetical protein